MDATQLDNLLALAEQTSRAAGQILLEHAAELRQVDFQDATDVKLRADSESEILIRERLSAVTAYPIVGEEQGGDTSLPTQDIPYWVVDPLDGTYNYLRQQPLCCVSIGLMQGTRPLLGVIYNFNDGSLYAARHGGPLLENGQPLSPSWPENDHEACIATGFPNGRDYGQEALLNFVHQVQRFKKVRMIGSAAMAIVYVATGRCDVYGEEAVRLWDVAAGLALAEAAGAHVTLKPNPRAPWACDLWIAGRKQWLLAR